MGKIRNAMRYLTGFIRFFLDDIISEARTHGVAKSSWIVIKFSLVILGYILFDYILEMYFGICTPPSCMFKHNLTNITNMTGG